ncbi:hypothetical protein [Caldicellulosiruptor morganii]|uniref:hypothetical protein n=1 Tax=Caldicellulosiruptor morganii TaxID=1387555 RepID=UPI0005EAF47B|nr:hypothetical protein [Caldicellulosiruptor morganii]
MRYLRYELLKRTRDIIYWIVLGSVTGFFAINYFKNKSAEMALAAILSILTAFIYTLVEYSSIFNSNKKYLIFGSSKLQGIQIILGRMVLVLLDMLVYFTLFVIMEILLNIFFRHQVQSFVLPGAARLLIKVFFSFKYFQTFLLFATSFFLAYSFILMVITMFNTILKNLNIWLGQLIGAILVISAAGVLLYSMTNLFVDTFIIPVLKKLNVLNGDLMLCITLILHILLTAVIILACARLVDEKLNL